MLIGSEFVLFLTMDCISSLPPLSHQGQQVPTINFINYYIVKRTDNITSFKNTFPFAIHKCFQSLLGGEVNALKKFHSADLMAKASSASQSNILFKYKQIGSFSVTVEAHRILNTSSGVILAADLLNSSNSELFENFGSQNVTNVQRINIHRNGKVLPTKHIILTFNSTVFPQKIKTANLSCPVRLYIPNPLRCLECQRYGHSKVSCGGSMKCAQLAEAGDDCNDCIKLKRCVNCKCDHASYFLSCPKWIFEKKSLLSKY